MPIREYKMNDKQVCAAFLLWLGVKDLRAKSHMKISLHPSGSATVTIEEPEPAPVIQPPTPEPRPHKVLPPFATSEFNREGY